MHHVDHGIYHDEGPRPANAGAAWTQNNQINDAQPSADGCVSVAKQRDLSSCRNARQSKCLTQIRELNPGLIGSMCQKTTRSLSAVPAVDHNGPRESWIDGLDLFEELQHADGRERNSEVRPAGEVELGDRSGSLGRIAGLLDTNRSKNTTFMNAGTRLLVPREHIRTVKASNAGRSTYVLDTEFTYGVIHQDGEVFNSHPHIAIHPAALIGPVLVTLVLHNTAIH